ncbi:MAG: transposase [Candidatus Omnitrophota bacterium]|nr:transposase [Candidatus Omnitrophota bacterium]
MVVADGAGLPLGSALAAASPAEVTLVDQTLQAIAVPRSGPGRPRQKPDRLIGDKAFDSDPLRTRLAQRGIELISPHRTNRVKPPTQDGRALRRYRRRWKIERLFAWLGHYRRLVIRYEHSLVMYSAFFHVACAMIVLRHL